MTIASTSLKYLDLCNYLVAGTSLDGFYKSYNLDTAKGSFCYQWFDSLEKLNYTGLPPQSCFRSILTNKEIDGETYMNCWTDSPAWSRDFSLYDLVISPSS